MEGAPRIMSSMASSADMSRMSEQHPARTKGYQSLRRLRRGSHVLALLLPGLPKLAHDFNEEERKRMQEEIGVEAEQGDIFGAASLLLGAGLDSCWPW